MWTALFGLLVGIAIGAAYPVTIPLIYARYTAVALIGLFDSIVGGLKANLQHRYDVSIFLSGVIFNMLLAMAITYLGDRLSLDLYLAVLVVFMFRIFKNLGQLRYALLTRFIGRRRVKEALTE